MSDERNVVYTFPEVAEEFLRQITKTAKQIEETAQNLDTLQPGTTLSAIQDYYDSMHEESKLRIELLKLQLEEAKLRSTSRESTNTIPMELKEVKQSLNALSGTMKGLDKRMKNVESQKQSTEKHDAVQPGKKGWRDGSTLPHNKGSRFERGDKNPAIPPLPPLNQMQPQNANEPNGDALHIEVAVPREDSSKKGPAAVPAPFNSSLSSQLSTKVKASGT